MVLARFVIVGIGAAGLSAAETIRQIRPSADVVLVAEDSHGYYSRPGLAYVLTDEVPESQLYPLNAERWRALGVRLIRGSAARLQPEEHRLVLDGGHSLNYDAVLLATGAAAVPLGVPGGDLDGVLTLDSMEDTRHILRVARRAREAVVVGGGITAIELVEGLRTQRVRVHYLMRGERFWRSVLDETESSIIEGRLAREGVVVHHHTEIARILGRRDWRGRERVAGVATSHGQVIHCQAVGAAIGVRPRLDLVAGTGIETDRGILVNQRLETSVAGVYAAGDVAQAYDPLTGQAQLDVLWPVAVAQGRVAGANMAGLPTTYDRGVPLNVTRLAGLLVTLIGAVGMRRQADADLVTISRGESEVWLGVPDAVVVQDQHEVNRQRLVIQKGRLIGAVLIGDQTHSRTIEQLVRDRIDLTPFLPALRAPHVDLAQVTQQIQDQLDQAGTSQYTLRSVP
jgi:NAD(P)H-nitrite reductase large subunit